MDILKSLVPLRKVVSAAVVDTYADLSNVEQTYYHWAARGLRTMARRHLDSHVKYALLTVNKFTNTATLPPDCDKVIFVGKIVNQRKVPIRQDGSIVLHPKYLENLSGIDCCEKCNQTKGVCDDLQITEEVEFVTINGTAYEKTTIRKLYPNGDYFLEITTPTLNLPDNTVTNVTEKQFITNLDLLDCGCLETSDDNLQKLQAACPEVYACYFTGCDNDCTVDYGSFREFPEQNLLQFDRKFRDGKVYVEYKGYLPKMNGQYYVPEVAFETLVNWTKFKSVENRRSIPLGERQWYFDRYRIELGNFEKETSQIDLAFIIESASRTPKFDLHSGTTWRDCYRKNQEKLKAQPDKVTQYEVVTSIVRTEEDTLVFVKHQFTIGQAGSLMQAGDTVLTINDAYVKEDSVNVVLNTQTLNENQNDEISYTVVYNLNSVVITFNSPAMDGQKYSISYAKTV